MAVVPLIEVRNLRRTYHVGDIDIEALRGVNLSIGRGEFVAIVGASGSGKSTLMSIVGCLDKPTAGEYWFDGVDVAQLDEPSLARIRSERIGFVFQNFNLLGRTTALENVLLPLFYSSADLGGAERSSRARAALERVGLAQRVGNTPAQLSGGQQQRVAIARALINSPRVLLADEPTGNLDTKTSIEILDTLTKLNRRDGVTIVLVTHEPDIAAYADRVVTMRDGEIVSDESKRERPPVPPTADAATPAQSGLQGAGAFRFAMMVASAAVQAIGRNKMRSALTMLGIFIGVAALITMVAVGEGANQAVKKQLENLGTNLLVVQPGATTTSGVRAGFGSASTLTVDDALALTRDNGAVAAVSYVNRQTGQVQYADKNWTTNIQGVSPEYARMTNWQIALGRGFTDEDENSTALVVIIGQTILNQLFGADQNPLGATILVKGNPLRVIGVLAPKGQTPWGQDQDDLVLIPFSTAEQKVLGVAAPTAPPTASTSIYASTGNPNYATSPNPFGLTPRLTGYARTVYVQAANENAVDAAIEQITNTLTRRHHLKPGDPPDFSVRNLSQIASAAEGSTRIMTLLLAAVASISLLVGGIGIMNILLVSVTERTREIGLRMAIGARRTDVLMQFLAEAIFLSVTGGLAGIIVGVALSKIVSAIAGWPTVVSVLSIAGAFLFSAAVGIFFGYYPARKGSQLDPIEALRYE